MDGNNRWAAKNKKNKFISYSNGASKLLNITNYIFSSSEANIVSAFALSNNNLKRSASLISTIKKILINFLNKELTDSKIDFKILFIGDLSFLSKEIQAKIKALEKKNINSKKKLIIFLNYSGRFDIYQSVLKIYKKNIRNLNNYLFKDHLLTNNIPDPDLLIRTGGFQRISDFMLYQLSFTELVFLKKLWPDISNSDLKKTIISYRKIDRKFGV